MSKHTVGPWHRNIKPASKYTTIWSGRNKHVAHVETRGLTEAEIEANISLIAAAPDLLAALKLAKTFLPIGFAATGRNGGADQRNADLTKARESVDAAIAKAEAAE